MLERDEKVTMPSEQVVLKYDPKTQCLDLFIGSVTKYQKISITRRVIHSMMYRGQIPNGIKEDLKV